MAEKNDTFKNRFNAAISKRNIKPIELAEKTKLSKSTISHYMSGYTKPKSDKLFILAKALDVNEQWLLGLDVPMERDSDLKYREHITLDTIAFEITGRSLRYSPLMFDAICRSMDQILSSAPKDTIYFNEEKKFNSVIEFLRDSKVSYEDKAIALKSVIDLVIYDTKKNHVDFFYSIDKSEYELNLNRIENLIQTLNDAGINKVIDYVTDLSNMPAYSKESPSGKGFPILRQSSNDCAQEHCIPDRSYLEPEAAHERTDTEVTSDMVQDDDNMMNDKNIWK